MKIIVAMALAVILVLLLLNRALKGPKAIDIVAVAENAAPLLVDFNRDLQQNLAAIATASPDAPSPTWTDAEGGLPLPRDPFQFQLPVEVQAAQAAALAKSLAQELRDSTPFEPEPVEERLRLQATAIDRYGKLALINDEMVSEGDMIQDYTVQRIRAGHVIVSQGDEVVHLRLEDKETP